MEDQGTMKSKKESGVKTDSLIGTSSSDSAANEEMDLSSDNTMVYALVEVSKDSEKTSKRQKIPLSTKDFYQVMQKFIDARKDKFDRKTLRPSLKRKYVVESGNSNTKIAKSQKQFINNKLANQHLRPLDKINITYKYSNHNNPEKMKKYEFYRTMYMKDQYKLFNPEKCCDLKVLYNRKTIFEDEGAEKNRDKNTSMSRGTNTDIVQTPKLLEDVLLTLRSNFSFGGKDEETDSKKECDAAGQSGNKCCDMKNQHSIPNLLFVPFIITDRTLEVSKKSTSSECMCNTEPTSYSILSQEVEFKANQAPNNNKINNGFTDFQSGTDSTSLHLNTASRTKVDCLTKEELSFNSMKEKKSHTVMTDHVHLSREEYFLEEVKTLQMKLNAIIKRLETNNVLASQQNYNNAANNKKKDTDSVGGKKFEERHNSMDSFFMPNSANPGPDQCPTQSKLEHCQDFSVQVVLMKSVSNRTVIMPSAKTSIIELDKALKMDKPTQIPSLDKIKIKQKRVGNLLVASKSSPFCQIGFECRMIKSKRTESLPTVAKEAGAADFLSLKNLGLKIEGSRCDTYDNRTAEKEIVKTQQKIKSKSDKQKKVTTAILYKKSFTVMHESGNNNRLVTPKKISTVPSNTSLLNKNQNVPAEKVLGGVKRSNKVARKAKPYVVPSSSNISNTTNNGSNADLLKNKRDERLRSAGKTGTPNVESKGKEKNSRSSSRRKAEDGKSTKGSTERAAKPEAAVKLSKLKKPMTPVRSSTKTKVQSMKVEFPSEKMVSRSCRDRRSYERMFIPRREEVITENVKRISEKNVEPSEANQNKVEKPAQNTEVQETPGTEVNLAEKKAGNTDKTVNQTTSNSGKPVDLYKTGYSKPPVISQVEESLAPIAKQTTSEKQSQELKSIWALTKVILYKDGSQSFEVLEASSTPPGYVLNPKKRKDSNNNNNSRSSSSSSSSNTNTNDTSNSSFNADNRKSNAIISNPLNKIDSKDITDSDNTSYSADNCC